jgi:dipeptidase
MMIISLELDTMKRLTLHWFILVLLPAYSGLIGAQNIVEYGQNYKVNCTSIMVGRMATTDGSVITSHSCDGPHRTWVEIFPHTKYEKSVVHAVYTGTLDPRETSFDMRKVKKIGEIPEVEETYAFLNTA